MVFDKIRQEVKDIDITKLIPIEDAPKENEKVLGTLDDDCIRLWGLAQAYKRRMMEAMIEANYAPTKEMRNRYGDMARGYEDKHHMLIKGFWMEIQEEFHMWGKSVSIRSGWQIVEPESVEEA